MTRILIVDDEKIFREHLKSLVNWKEHDFEICAEASGGLEAKELIETLRPDIVITDIHMAEVDGLSLISYISQNHPFLPTIVLSGYDEFEYVRKSMLGGVIDYILKHKASKSTILSAVESARRRIAENKNEQSERSRRTEQAQHGQVFLRREFLRELLDGEIPDSTSFKERAGRLQIAADADSFVLVIAEIDNMSEHKERYSDAEWHSFFKKAIDAVEILVGESGGGIVLPQFERRFVVFFSVQSCFSLLRFYHHLHACIQSIRSTLKKHYNLTACYSISESVSAPGDVPKIYEHACAALDEKIYHDFDMVLQSSTPEKARKEAHFNLSLSDEQAILRLTRAGDRQALASYMNRIFTGCRENHISAPRMQILFAELLNILNRLLRQDKMDMMDFAAFHNVFARVQYMTLNEMNRFILGYYFAVMDKREGISYAEHCHEVTKHAAAYINRCYSDNISLSDISESVGVSPSYLSRVFREDLEKTVTEYLNGVRIEHAKQMIEEGMRLGDLSEEVGFNSNTYFFTVFKQTTGKTPTEYKRQIEKKTTVSR